jgi:16S rRNA (cytosine967-C5)-methyltransferase
LQKGRAMDLACYFCSWQRPSNKEFMSRHHSHINTAITIMSKYEGPSAFAPVLKAFFKEFKKYGSKDRRQIGNLCYCYFRAIRVLNEDLSLEEKIILAYFLCTPGENPLITELKPEWAAFAEFTIQDKFAQFGLDASLLFPKIESIEEAIDKEEFAYSHFVQPDLFLRLRPKRGEIAKKKLTEANIPFKHITVDCLALPNTSRVEEILLINKEVVIQDYASQRVGKMLEKVKAMLPSSAEKTKVWDCCAASGGKAILAVDKLGAVDLTLSDIRQSILENLKVRMQEAQIVNYKSLKLDITNPKRMDAIGDFDLIIADVPCTGSGTWSRNPERLRYFNKKEISRYVKMQKDITSSIQSKLKPGGLLLYITCSVYQQENSEIVNDLVATTDLTLIESQIILGSQYLSDTMYVALLKKEG